LVAQKIAYDYWILK